MAKLIPNHPITLKISFFTQQPPLRHDVQLLNHVDGVAGAWDPKVAAISKQETMLVLQPLSFSMLVLVSLKCLYT